MARNGRVYSNHALILTVEIINQVIFGEIREKDYFCRVMNLESISH